MSLASASGTIPFLKRGATGRTPKFMGVYSPDVTYTSDDYVAPLVLHVIYKVDGDPTSGIKSTDYYIMFGDNYRWTGKNEETAPWEEATKKNDDPTKRWSLFAGFSTIAAEIAFIRFGLMAGAVMAQEGDAKNGYTYAKMFSQTGQDGTTDYEKFDPSKDANDSSQRWKPTACIDWLSGKSWFTNTTISGTIYATSGTIGGFEIGNGRIGIANGSSSTNNGMFLYDNMIGFNATNKQVVIGDISLMGYDFLGRFSDSKPDTVKNGVSISVTNGTYENTALSLRASGGKIADDAIDAGDHALSIPQGHIQGFRLRTRRIKSSTILSTMDSIIYVIASNVTLTLPQDAEDGQFYMIIMVGWKRSCKIVGSFDGGPSITLNEYCAAFLTFDKANNLWYAEYADHF